MKSYEELINQVKDLIRKNKTNKALEILAKEQLSSLDKQLILINSRYSKLKEDQTLGILDEETAQRRLNIINVELLALAEKIGKDQDKIDDLPTEEIATVSTPPTSTPPAPEIKKQTSPANPSSEGKSKSKLYLGAMVGVFLVALIAYFGMQQSAKKAKIKKQAKIEMAKKKRAKEVRDSIAKVEFDLAEKTKQDAINRAKNIAIGNTFEGGIIFYVDPSGQHGLIMAKGDQSDKVIDWFPGAKGKAFATDTGIFDGEKNTKLLVAKFKEKNHPAQLCKKFKFEGFNDWYLPSQDELDLLYEYNNTLPKAQKMAHKYYWSSTEIANQDVYYRSFFDGKKYYKIGKNKAKVRAIRKF
ncbi:MAG: DUF1566 domain-containing protein [Saprospiraceae bacterium]